MINRIKIEMINPVINSYRWQNINTLIEEILKCYTKKTEKKTKYLKNQHPKEKYK